MEVAQQHTADTMPQSVADNAGTAAVAGVVPKKNVLQPILGWPLSRKIAAGVILLITVALFAIIILQARTADQQLLYANLNETDAASVVNWLKSQRIPYSLKNNGRNIWVPADTIYETRLSLAANGLPSGGSVGFEVFDNQSFALTDYVQKVNYTRALQGELARTITSLAPVDSTRVHLAIPEKRLFKNQQKNATASVIITLLPGRALDREQVKGIVHLVAGSVSGLQPEHVKVIDSNGMVLEADEPAKDEQMLSVDMLAFQQEVEHRLEMRAQELLDKTMGQDKAMVRVSATLDFSKVEKTQELFDADEPVVRSEQVNQENSSKQTTGGIPGVESNLEDLSGKSSKGPTNAKSSRVTNYEISKTISKIVNPVGTITNLSVSVLVADKTAGETAAEGSVIQRSEEELEAIRGMVSAALGLVPERGDQINVLSMPFIDPVPAANVEGAPPARTLYHYLPFIKISLVCLGVVLLYFFLLRPLIKTMRGEVTAHYKTVDQLEREQSERLALQHQAVEPLQDVDEAIIKLRQDVNKNQYETAHIIKNWIQEG